MRNIIVGKLERIDFDDKIGRILKDLGSPEPPLNLDNVRELLKLDRQYYSSNDDSHLQEFVHVMMMAGKQVFQNPRRLLDVIKTAKISALWVPEKRQILIDRSAPQLKHRWMEGHEISHSLADWHQQYLFGDNKQSLSQQCHETLEAEANYGSGRLLFLGPKFGEEASQLSISMSTVLSLSERYGNSKTSTFWRYVEGGHRSKTLLGMIVPQLGRGDCSKVECKHLIESPEFKAKFNILCPTTLAQQIYCKLSPRYNGGDFGTAELTIPDRNNSFHHFEFEAWSNSYEIHILGSCS